MISPDEFFRDLTVSSTSLSEAHERHMEFNYGECIPHVLMGEFSGAILQLFQRSTREPVARRELADILQALERGASGGDEQVLNLINVSFLENIVDDESYASLRDRFGPALRLNSSTLTRQWSLLLSRYHRAKSRC